MRWKVLRPRLSFLENLQLYQIPTRWRPVVHESSNGVDAWFVFLHFRATPWPRPLRTPYLENVLKMVLTLNALPAPVIWREDTKMNAAHSQQGTERKGCESEDLKGEFKVILCRKRYFLFSFTLKDGSKKHRTSSSWFRLFLGSHVHYSLAGKTVTSFKTDFFLFY